jgi:hypothetical protein
VAFALPSGLAPEIAAGVWSPGYGELVHGSVALVMGALRCPATLVTLLAVIDRPS